METTRNFSKAKTFVAAYAALGTAVLVAVVLLRATGHTVTAFMWGRTGGVLASAAVLYWLTVVAARGARWAFVRIRLLTVVMPAAIVAIDVIPGTLPTWFVLVQGVCALALVPAAFVVNGPGLRTAFPKSR
ncbi:hypothetical protein ACFYVL_20255 [Streptomyces sp. NPDC004111]|uniref:hypothetical protein n=1 Tax=Streptomyces sp. NPDC004111 TaxID=3364690 RepID=UPI0036942EF2